MENKKKLKRVLIVMGIISILLVAFVLYFGKKGFTKEGRYNKLNEDNINYIYDYIYQNLNGNLAYPQGDLILMDSSFNQIYQENKNNYFDDFGEVYVIQGNTCGLDLRDQTKKYDVRFSDDKHKRCYEYAITKDKKYFQLGRVEKGFFGYESKVKGNTGTNFLRDYSSSNFVKDGDSQRFVYFPSSNNNLEFEILQGNPDVKIELDDSEFKDFSKSGLKDGIFLGGNKTVGIYMKGEKFLAKLSFPNGGYVFLGPANQKSEIYIRKVGLDKNKSDLVMKNLKGIFWTDFPTPSSNSDNRIYDNYGGSYILNANQSFFYSSGDVFASLIMQGSLEFIQKMQSYYFQKGFVNATLRENNISILDSQYQDSIKDIIGFKINFDAYKKNKKNIKVSKADNLQNTMINYLNGKGIKQNEVWDVLINNKSYKIISFSGNINQDFAKNIKGYIQRNNVSNLNIDSLLDNVCGEKKSKIGIDEFVNFFDSYNDSKKSLDFDENLINILKNKNIILGDKSSRMRSLGYWDYSMQSFGYITDLMETQKNLDDFVLICK